MPVRKAEAVWDGTLFEGRGRMTTASGSVDAEYSAGMRFGEEPGTSPEELIGAAHAGCFSMAFALELEQAGFPPQRINTSAKVTIEETGDGFTITNSELATEAQVPRIDEHTFQRCAEAAKKGCPVSRALTEVDVSLTATLLTR